ncbi:LysR family transcriptional regulator [Elstera sp.]|jgi:DNA-binding transcriptional LysR family regulator|uniref:LysR family transcriptional regulator n=1 Tax=Elstera sp. TaxID=1916664 RepID=UPI0037C13C67
MLAITDLRFLYAISKARSLAAAARALDVTPPAVSQRLAQIENRLGLRLVERGVGGLHLTAEGELLASRGAVILSDLDELTDVLAERRSVVSGPLRVIAPFGFGRVHVAPPMASFALQHPEVTPSLILTDDPRGTMRIDGWDVLIHVGRLPDLDILQRKLATNRRLLCAAPDYGDRHGFPERPSDLRNHRCGVVREDQADVTLWSLTGPSGEKETIRIHPAFASNDGEVIRAWVLAGMGIVERSEWSVAADLREGRLISVLDQWGLPDADVIALLNPRSVRAARTESFVHHLAETLATRSWLRA